AIHYHDYGWRLIDMQPFWNDWKQAPYAFTDFPTMSKIIFYTYGIDQVVKKDRYAGLLSSRHYTRFLESHPSEEAQAFVQREKARQEQLIKAIPEFGRDWYDVHYGLLQICDDLSLYICLN